MSENHDPTKFAIELWGMINKTVYGFFCGSFLYLTCGIE